MNMHEYLTLGRSGLRVSPLCLGTMTFGTEWGWGSTEETSKAMFDTYVGAGGNFIDTADGYTGGKSEEMLGKFIREGKLRDRIVLATKFTFNQEEGNPNAGGNGRKNACRALETSLRRLQTDYIDLYWMHAWDKVTPVEEVVNTFNDFVREGKIRYFGFSDVPAWYIARAQTLAELRGAEGLIALQLEYSLVERNIEREHVPVARELGMGICPWSPLASGFLTGKYTRENRPAESRLEVMKDTQNPGFKKFNEKNWRILDTLLDVARQLGKAPAEIALNWVATQPGVSSTIIGATKIQQLKSNLSSLDFEIPAELRKGLDEVSAIEPVHPYVFFDEFIQGMIHGGLKVKGWNG
jgi:aryl-alcohol dehydrogenase-like predicted oxidoreductase